MRLSSAKIFLYSSGRQSRPFHRDAHADNRSLQQQQNISVIVSFGGTRTLTFRHLLSGEEQAFVLKNGMAFAFGSRINIIWEHGIKALDAGEASGARISIAAWGMC